MYNGYGNDPAGIYLLILLGVVATAINLGLLYLVVKTAIVHGMRRARREDWTEVHDSGNAHWLTVLQRKTLAEQRPQWGAQDPKPEA